MDDDNAFILIDGSTYNPTEDAFRIVPMDSLIIDEDGDYYRQWRPEIKKPDDIWNEIQKATQMPGLTSAPKLSYNFV